MSARSLRSFRFVGLVGVLWLGGVFSVYASYPHFDGLFREQAADTDRASARPLSRRSGLGLITGHASSAPDEDLTLELNGA